MGRAQGLAEYQPKQPGRLSARRSTGHKQAVAAGYVSPLTPSTPRPALLREKEPTGTTGVKEDFVLRAPQLQANTTEAAFQRLAHAAGWNSFKRGWPDFLCFGPAGEIIAVEVKPRSRLTGRLGLLKREQAISMDALRDHGIHCFVSDGVTLEPYERAKHAPANRRRNGSEDADTPTPQVRRDFALKRALRRGQAA